MTVACYPGSFDPFTLGHLDVARRAARLFDVVVVGVAKNPGKAGLLPLSERLALIEEAIVTEPDLANVRVAEVPGLVADFCRDQGVTVLVRGIRDVNDLATETPMALMNHHLADVETVFLPASAVTAHIASSLVKDIARHGGPIADLVPVGVAAAVLAATKGEQ